MALLARLLFLPSSEKSGADVHFLRERAVAPTANTPLQVVCICAGRGGRKRKKEKSKRLGLGDGKRDDLILRQIDSQDNPEPNDDITPHGSAVYLTIVSNGSAWKPPDGGAVLLSTRSLQRATGPKIWVGALHPDQVVLIRPATEGFWGEGSEEEFHSRSYNNSVGSIGQVGTIVLSHVVLTMILGSRREGGGGGASFCTQSLGRPSRLLSPHTLTRHVSGED